jgi:hypothetical protein
VMYGIGARFDHQPELLFRLRAVDEMELIVNAGKAAPLTKHGPAAGKILASDDLSGIFGLDMAQSDSPGAGLTERKTAKPKGAEKSAAVPARKRKIAKRAAIGRKPRRPKEG